MHPARPHSVSCRGVTSEKQWWVTLAGIYWRHRPCPSMQLSLFQLQAVLCWPWPLYWELGSTGSCADRRAFHYCWAKWLWEIIIFNEAQLFHSAGRGETCVCCQLHIQYNLNPEQAPGSFGGGGAEASRENIHHGWDRWGRSSRFRRFVREGIPP